MKLRSLAAALTVGSLLSLTTPALAQTGGLPPVTLPPLPVPLPPLPPVTVPPLPVPLPTIPPLPTPTPTPSPTLPGNPLPTPTLPTPGGALPGGAIPPTPGSGTPALPGLPGVDGLPGAGAIPGGSDPAAIVSTLAATGSGILPTGPGLPTDLADIAQLQRAFDLVLDTVTTTVCQVLNVAAVHIRPVTAALAQPLADLPTSSVGTSLGGAVGFRLDLQALSQLPASTLLTMSAALPGLLTIDLALPNCPEGNPTDPPSPGGGDELIPPTSTARTLTIVGSPVSVTRPAPALPSGPAFTG